MRTLHALGLSVALAVAAGSVVGCGNDSDRPKYREITGRITSIDLKTGVVSMSYHNPKHKREMPLSGRLAPDAEVFINGATARLQDLRVDDHVTVTGRRDKRDGEHPLIATRVHVTREERPSPGASTQPAKRDASSTEPSP